jgi:uncharacterized protein with PIN domain
MKITQGQRNIPIAFFADAMLGKLARWLRMLGYNTAYERNIDDADIVDRALRENRWLLTRDRCLVERKILQGRYTLVHSDYLTDQLRQLQHERVVRLVVDSGTHGRCAECNRPLEMITRQEAAPRVPHFVACHYEDFALCPECSRVYWPGTHWAHLQHQLQDLRLHPQM